MNDSYYPVQHTQTNQAMSTPSPHNRWLILFLALFFGMLGVHRFAVGKIWTGLFMFFTGGGFGFLWAFDILMLLLGNFTDSNGLRLGSEPTHHHNRQLTHQNYQQPRQLQQPSQPEYGSWGGEDGELDAFVEEDPLEAKFADLEKEMRRRGQRVD